MEQLIINTESWNEIYNAYLRDEDPPQMDPVLVYNRETGVFSWRSALNSTDDHEYTLGRQMDVWGWFADGEYGDWIEQDIRYFITPIVGEIDESNED